MFLVSDCARRNLTQPPLRVRSFFSPALRAMANLEFFPVYWFADSNSSPLGMIRPGLIAADSQFANHESVAVAYAYDVLWSRWLSEHLAAESSGMATTFRYPPAMREVSPRPGIPILRYTVDVAPRNVSFFLVVGVVYIWPDGSGIGVFAV